MSVCDHACAHRCCALNTVGQCLSHVPPFHTGDESYDLYAKERDGIFNSLGYRAQLLVDGLNALPGISCNPSEGAMYAVRGLDRICPTSVHFTMRIANKLPKPDASGAWHVCSLPRVFHNVNSSPRSICQRRPSLRPKLGEWSLISFTAKPCSTPPASALSPVGVTDASAPVLTLSSKLLSMTDVSTHTACRLGLRAGGRDLPLQNDFPPTGGRNGEGDPTYGQVPG